MMKELNGRIYRFANFELDAANRHLRRDDQPVQLPAKAFDLLLALVENKNRLVEKDELFRNVWRDQIVEESNLTVHISQIRKALGETKKNPRFIETVSGYGYRFVGDVTNSGEENLIIETETLSRITIEKEAISDAEAQEEKTDAEENGAQQWPAINGQLELSALTNSSHSAQLQISKHESQSENRSEISNLKSSIGKRQKTDDGKQTKAFFPNRAFSFGAIMAILLLAAGFGFWLYDSKQKNQGGAIPFADARVRQLTTNGKVGWAALSPDGKFYSYSLNERGEFAQSLWLRQTGGGSDIQLRPAVGIYRGMVFSPDGKTLYFTVSNTEQTAQNGLFKMPAFGGVAEKLPLDVRGFFALSPDGKQVAFTRPKKESSALIVANLDGTGEREISTRPLDVPFGSRLSWSPDGERIAIFAAADAVKESSEIFVMRVSNGQAERLTTLDWTLASNLIWQHDGKGLIVVATGQNESVRHLWHVDYPNGTAQRIANDTDSYGSALVFPLTENPF